MRTLRRISLRPSATLPPPWPAAGNPRCGDWGWPSDASSNLWRRWFSTPTRQSRLGEVGANLYSPKTTPCISHRRMPHLPPSSPDRWIDCWGALLGARLRGIRAATCTRRQSLRNIRVPATGLADQPILADIAAPGAVSDGLWLCSRSSGVGDQGSGALPLLAPEVCGGSPDARVRPLLALWASRLCPAQPHVPIR